MITFDAWIPLKLQEKNISKARHVVELVGDSNVMFMKCPLCLRVA